jgi:hypothetical protein
MKHPGGDLPPDREPGSDDDDPTPAIDLEALRREEAKRDQAEREKRETSG